MDMCDKCGKNPATVRITKVVNGQKTEIKLCAECAAAQDSMGASPIAKLLLSLVNGRSAGAESIKVPAKCQYCGYDFAQFARTSMLGCEKCYEAFEPALRPMIRRMQGSLEYRGHKKAAPETQGDGAVGELAQQTSALQEELKAAIESEEYEKAAELRDRIRALKDCGGEGQ